MSSVLSDFVVTPEYRRFAEFCDACRRYRYIGLCYGAPGVGKTLSARHYANWEQIEAYRPHHRDCDVDLDVLFEGQTIFYTPKVANSPRQIDQEIRAWRERLRAIPLDRLYREEEKVMERARHEHKVRPRELVEQIVEFYAEKRRDASDPTALLMVDEADRLKTAGLEQVRDIFDQGDMGVVLIGMPGLEKRLARYPQLYSRVGFVHAFRPLSVAQVRDLLQRKWTPSGVTLPEAGVTDEEALASIIRITGGNFRLLNRLLTQIARLVEINALQSITSEVVEAARESLVIGIS